MSKASFGFLLFAAGVVSAGYSFGSNPSSTCSSEPSFYSCENTTVIENTCCTPTPGGLVLLTQFWSTWTGRESEDQLLPAASWVSSCHAVNHNLF